MNLLRLLFCFLLLAVASAVQATEFSAKVIAVLDGDTLLVLRAGKPVRLRLAEVDAPEVGHAGAGGKQPNSQEAQPYGVAAQKSLEEMVMGMQVRVSSRAVDAYGRIVALVSIDGLNVNREQVRRGMAWEYSRFHSNRELMALQREAQQARRGLWAGGEAIEPSQWRKQHPTGLSAAAPAIIRGQPAPAVTDPACVKTRCSQMVSCAEAMQVLARCHHATLDGDGDGKPCENLCASGSTGAVPPQKMR